MQSKEYLKARDLLAQNSALLAAIDDVLEEPQEFPLTVDQGRYQLPVKRERELSEDIAFLAARKKDPTKVIAVAIEEDQDKQGMTIRIAVNQGDLSIVKDGLTRIAQIMQRASTRTETRSTLQPQLLQTIIALNQPRILSRLRSRHACSNVWRPSGEPLLHLLKQHIDDGLAAMISSRRSSYKGLQEQCRMLTAMFVRLEALQSLHAEAEAGQMIASEILQTIVGLLEKFDVVAVLRSSKHIDPTLLKSLPLSLAKLVRYHKLSSALVEAARESRYTIFRTIRVAIVNANEFIKTPVILKYHPFDEVLARFKTRKTNPQVVNRARSKPWTLTGNKKYIWRIHAEIQLLSYYQFRKLDNTPRVLGASKSSCYLCCQFIRMHGQFQVPRTHGRLYSQWTLPDIPNNIGNNLFLGVLQELNQRLENEIRKALMQSVKKTNYPSESVTAFHPPWSPASTLIVLETVNEDDTMPSPAANVSLPCLDRLSIANVGFESHGVDPGTSSLGVSILPLGAESEPGADETSKEEFASQNQTVISLSTDDGVYLDITPGWSCYKLPSSSRGIWCHYEGLNLYLDSENDDSLTGSSRDHRYWVGIKTADLNSNIPYGELQNCFNVANLDLIEHISSAGAALSSTSLILTWQACALIIKFNVGNPPEDPLPAI